MLKLLIILNFFFCLDSLIEKELKTKVFSTVLFFSDANYKQSKVEKTKTSQTSIQLWMGLVKRRNNRNYKRSEIESEDVEDFFGIEPSINQCNANRNYKIK
jgi:hypothetical protein